MADRWRAVCGGLAVALPFALGTAAAAEPEGGGEVVLSFVDPEIHESSGLVVTPDRVVTTNDSGDEGRVFVVDRATGRTVGVTRWSADPYDVEALADAGPGSVWVADIGDNRTSREAVEVVRVPVGDVDQTVDVAPSRLVYPRGPRDAEALLAHPRTGQLLVVTKGVFSGEIHRAPASLVPGATHRLSRVAQAPALVTGGDFFPDGRHLVLRTYTHAHVLAYPSFEVVGSWRLPDQPQGEGVAVGSDGALYLSSEGSHAEVLRVEVPADIERAMGSPDGQEPADGPTSRPDRAPAQPGPGGSAASGTVEPDPWPWLAGGLLAVVAGVVLLRSLRPH